MRRSRLSVILPPYCASDTMYLQHTISTTDSSQSVSEQEPTLFAGRGMDVHCKLHGTDAVCYGVMLLLEGGP